ncbi:uncharacterized protein LOC128267828 [Anopheles cruzii]|uniref:uncharacterized protein LOC128267828 n=1 Tax=Anopheles cruzii TaxID=68878 RepID=UPI0022EC3D7A|nr:uncharacterized protein LOC128267828 [Anopheles cruzii]
MAAAAAYRTIVWLLLGFLVHRTSLLASAQSFGPLIRTRAPATPAKTSQEDLNHNIQSIYDPHYRAPPTISGRNTSDSMPDELVTRAGARVKQPVGSTEVSPGSSILYVYRGVNGSLMPLFGSTTPVPPTGTGSGASPAENQAFVARPTTSELDINVLRLAIDGNATADRNTTTDGVTFDKQSYPDDYPFERIQAILKKKREIYRDVFEEQVVLNSLVTRLDSPTDRYLCSSTRANEYPTHHHKTGQYIVNVRGFYQSVTFEHCDNIGALCSNARTDSNSTLVCEQIYSTYDVYVVPNTDTGGSFQRLALEFPSCCKCKHVPK